jgi:hypothetical protein
MRKNVFECHERSQCQRPCHVHGFQIRERSRRKPTDSQTLSARQRDSTGSQQTQSGEPPPFRGPEPLNQGSAPRSGSSRCLLTALTDSSSKRIEPRPRSASAYSHRSSYSGSCCAKCSCRNVSELPPTEQLCLASSDTRGAQVPLCPLRHWVALITAA